MSDISPEIAALLEQTEAEMKNTEKSDSAKQNPKKDAKAATSSSVDLSKKEFPKITDYISKTLVTQIFEDKGYYKGVLSNECESAQRVHALLSKYLTCQEPKDKVMYRQQMLSPYWEVVRSIAKKFTDPTTPECKKMMVRYGILLPTLLTQDNIKFFESAFQKNTYNEPVYYLDEWFDNILRGNITISATDERRPTQKAGAAGSVQETSRLMQLKTKNQGKIQNAETLLSSKENERQNLENSVHSELDQFCDHPVFAGLHHKQALSDAQKKLASSMVDKLKLLLRVDKEIGQYLRDLEEACKIGESLDEKLANAGDTISEVNNEDFNTEFETVRQMAKMTVGRMGNHYPILTKEFFHCPPKNVGLRENVIRELAWVESLDPSAFCRIHKNVSNRIVPYVILLPTYGDRGFCWEPFDRYNRVTSRGRIIIPMYPKNLQTSVLLACADLRWQVAKEKASFYWMEEGLTGQYYQWFAAQHLKGDVKDKFIEDYILWMRFESEGMLKLDKEVRGIFWRNMPFPLERREMLKKRSLIYQELFQKDINRSMSDGY